jgi:DNA-directed RNA polymerase subunit RPC12/RpoP
MARGQLEMAEKLLNGNDDEVIVACLKLRQCIESLSYGLLALYRHELSQSAMTSWTPRKVLNELQEADPTANSSHAITIGIPATADSPEKIILSGEDRRFSPKWADKAYNKLSNIIHVPTPRMMEAKGAMSPEQIRTQCIEYARVLRDVFRTEIWHFIGGRFLNHACDCGFLIKRRLESINAQTVFECSECGRKYDVTSIDDREIGVTLRVAMWKCPTCNSDNEMSAHELVEGKEIRCPRCDGRFKIERPWLFSKPVGATHNA